MSTLKTEKMLENNTLRFHFPVNRNSIEIIREMMNAEESYADEVDYLERIALFPLDQAIEVFKAYVELHSKEDSIYSRYYAGYLETSDVLGAVWFVLKPITTYRKGRAENWNRK